MNFDFYLLLYLARKNFFGLGMNKIFLFLSTVPLVLAYILEVFFYALPCNLCLWQRMPFFVIIFLAFINLKFQKKWIFYLILLCFLGNSILAVFNVVVELGWIDAKCAVKASEPSILDGIIPNSPIPCNMPYFQFFDFISIAFLNILYCLFCILIGYLYPKLGIKYNPDYKENYKYLCGKIDNKNT